jgi:PHD and RING finger domain-containing protein 1
MLLCDSCDNGYHLDCLNPVLDEIPIGVWYCVECIQESENESNEDVEDEEVVFNLPEMEISTSNCVPTRTRGSRTTATTTANYRQIARTRFSERIRRRINNNRLERGASIVISESEDEDEEDEISEKQEIQPTTSSSSVAVVKKSVKKKRRRRRKTYRRKTRSRTSNGKKTYKKRKVKRRKRRVTVKKTDTQRRIANILKSYQSMPKVIEERIEEKKRIDSGIRVFKPFQPTLESEYSEFEESSIRKREETKPSTSSKNEVDILSSILESQKKLFSNWTTSTIKR